MNNIFQFVKDNVTVLEVAESYGLKLFRGNMCVCPFHSDKNPSMKIQEDYYYCFACGAHGDAIDLVSHLCGVGALDAALRIVTEFQLVNFEKTQEKKDDILTIPEQLSTTDFNLVYETCTEMCFKASQAIREHEPKPGDDWSDEFCHAINCRNQAEYYLFILDYGTESEKQELITKLTGGFK